MMPEPCKIRVLAFLGRIWKMNVRPKNSGTRRTIRPGPRGAGGYPTAGSGFFDNGHKKDTGLAGYLRGRKAHDLYFCGLAADVCVQYTVKDALREGFSATLIDDGTRPLDEEEFAKIKKELVEKGCKIIKSVQLL